MEEAVSSEIIYKCTRLRLLTTKTQIGAAQRMLRNVLRAQSTRAGKVRLEFQGGSQTAQGAWFQERDLWYGFRKLDEYGRYWNAFGRTRGLPRAPELGPG